jgi:hypothetical protein
MIVLHVILFYKTVMMNQKRFKNFFFMQQHTDSGERRARFKMIRTQTGTASGSTQTGTTIFTGMRKEDLDRLIPAVTRYLCDFCYCDIW